MIENIKMPEILSPAGNFEKMKGAIHYGADAVYISGKSFGMRAAADNFTKEEMIEAVKFAHERNKKVYVTVNTMPRNNEFYFIDEYLNDIKEAKPDAVIVADPGVLIRCKRIIPEIDIHISTQGATVNYETCNFWYDLGAKRVVLARELSLDEIIEIKQKCSNKLEIEAFIHGAMCVSFSGRCLLSEYFTGRDANRGECTQPCRWIYHFAEEKRPDDILTCEVHNEGSYIFGSKDLCMIDHIKELVQSGIDSLKIEGRMKSEYYTSLVTNCYRIALDEYREFGEVKTESELFHKELESVSHREYCTGYYFNKTIDKTNIASIPGYMSEKSFLAKVVYYDKEKNIALLHQKNKFSLNDDCEVISPAKLGKKIKISAMYDLKGNEIDSCPHPEMEFLIKTDCELKKGDIIRKLQ